MERCSRLIDTDGRCDRMSRAGEQKGFSGRKRRRQMSPHLFLPPLNLCTREPTRIGSGAYTQGNDEIGEGALAEKEVQRHKAEREMRLRRERAHLTARGS